MEIAMYFDGASKGNPGLAGAGYWFTDKDQEQDEQITSGYKFLGIQTNNEAEYQALILGLKALVTSPSKYSGYSVKVYGDSKLVIEHMKKNWKVKAPNLIPLWKEAQELIKGFKKIEFFHIDRNLNSVADSLANKAIETRSLTSN